MKTTFISNRVEWAEGLADALGGSSEGDIIVVPSYVIKDLAQNAIRRHPDKKYVRVMTSDTYRDIAEADGEQA